MASWNKLKQATRETFGNKDQRTETPGDVKSLLSKGESVEKLMQSTINNAIYCFPERKVKTKNADDPVREQPLYAVGMSLQELGAIYQTDAETKRFMMASSKAVTQIAGLKADLDETVQKAFVEPKRDVNKQVADAYVHNELLKEKRLELDAKKHKLKQEKKSGDGGKMRKYEVEVDLAQEKFDAEVDAIRELLGPVADDRTQGEEQVQQTMAMMSAMKTYFQQSLRILEDFERSSSNNCNSNSSRTAPTAALRLVQSPTTPILQTTPTRLSQNLRSPIDYSAQSSARSSPLRMTAPQHVKPFGSSTPNLAIAPKPPMPLLINKPQLQQQNTQKKCAALYNFAKEQDGDLAFETGDMIQIIKDSDEWWEGMNLRTGKTGIFPANYVKIII